MKIRQRYYHHRHHHSRQQYHHRHHYLQFWSMLLRNTASMMKSFISGSRWIQNSSSLSSPSPPPPSPQSYQHYHHRYHHLQFWSMLLQSTASMKKSFISGCGWWLDNASSLPAPPPPPQSSTLPSPSSSLTTLVDVTVNQILQGSVPPLGVLPDVEQQRHHHVLDIAVHVDDLDALALDLHRKHVHGQVRVEEPGRGLVLDLLDLRGLHHGELFGAFFVLRLAHQ